MLDNLFLLLLVMVRIFIFGLIISIWRWCFLRSIGKNLIEKSIKFDEISRKIIFPNSKFKKLMIEFKSYIYSEIYLTFFLLKITIYICR
jgi:hypothetical protein